MATMTFALLLASPLLAASPAPMSADRLRTVGVKNVQINGFWNDRLRACIDQFIPHAWQYMTNEIRAVRKAAGEKVDGELNGTWGEANLFKFLETIAYSLAISPDPALEKRADDLIALLGRAQQPDGYVHAHIVNSKKPKWDPGFLDGSHDGYVLGHLIEAAIEYHAATGKRAFLDIACKAANQAYEHFLGPNGKPGFCGHAELEMALVELYRVVPDPRYIELSKAFVEWRGHGIVTPAGPTPRAYFQDEQPLRLQRTLEGHAVRAIFFATGVTDLAIESVDPDYRLAANRFWDSTTLRRMTITGSVGPRKEHEAFGEDYELPNNGYYESCAACGLADFAHRMFLLEKQADSVEVLERVLYNAILHGIALNGLTTYYMNPLSDRDNPRYNSWVCCPPNLSRTILQIGRYAYAHSSSEVYVNLYVAGTANLPLKSGPLRLTVKTDYPWDGHILLKVDPVSPSRFALNLRIPQWCRAATLRLNGQAMPASRRGWAKLDREWHPGDTVELHLDMPVQRIVPHPNIRDCGGRVAIQRGPLVYAVEALDNAGRIHIELPPDPVFQVERRPDLLGGITVITGNATDAKPFTAIPFYALANRVKSSQEVWFRQSNLKLTDEWWTGQLYRPLKPTELAK